MVDLDAQASESLPPPKNSGPGGRTVIAREIEFGPFKLNPAHLELRRRGLRLPVSRLRLLSLFLSRPGELITREEIAECLWKDSQNVDVMSGINTAVNQLRACLGDDSSSPRYIETVIGAGYRFIADVKDVADPGPLKDGTNPAGELSAAAVAEASYATAVEAANGVGSYPATAAAEQPEPEHPAPAAPQGDTPGRRVFHHPWKLAVSLLASSIIISGFFLHFGSPFPNSGRNLLTENLELTRVTISGDIKAADISPDGKYVAYARLISGEESLWLRQLATGRVLQVTTLGTDRCWGVDFSADGNYLYFDRHRPSAAAGDLYRISTLGGEATRVLPGISGVPAISPDGLKVAFVRSTLMSHGVDSVVTANIDGSDLRILASYPAPGIHLNRVTWTADGRTLIFPSRNMLIALPLNGGAARALSSQPWHSIDDVWGLGPDSTLMVVGQLADFKRSQLYLVPLAGGTVRAITHELSDYIAIRGTADGKALLGVHKVVLSTLQTLASGKELETRTLSSENQNEDGGLGLAWAPNDRIAYITQSDSLSLTVINSDGSTPHQYISTASDGLSDVAVSPRGDSMVFVRWSQGDRANLYLIDLKDGRETRLTEGTQDFSPSFDPDGQSIVYAGIQADKTVLMKVSIHGGTPTVLTSYNADHPSVSPDGAWIACSYVPRSDQPPVLAILPITGGPPKRTFVLPPTATASPLAWTPDGRAVSFVNNENGVSNIWQQPVSGGPAVANTHFKSGTIFNFQWSRDGRLALSRGSEMTDAVLIKNFR